MSRFTVPGAWGARTKNTPRWLLSTLLLTVVVIISGLAPALAQDEALPSYIELADGETLADKQEITIGVNRNLVNGEEDFWYAHASLQVWEPLIRYDNEFRLEPGLAESWELSRGRADLDLPPARRTRSSRTARRIHRRRCWQASSTPALRAAGRRSFSAASTSKRSTAIRPA